MVGREAVLVAVQEVVLGAAREVVLEAVLGKGELYLFFIFLGTRRVVVVW